MRVILLSENTTYRRDVGAEHGLSFLVESKEGRILFDTGQSRLFLENARRLGVTLDGIDTVFISHGHFDHTGGLVHLPFPAAVYGHPDIFRERYAKPKGAGAARSIGIPFSREELESGRDGLRFRLSREPVTVAGFTLTGEVEYRNEFEPPSDRFFLDAGCTKPDDIPDDQSVFFETGGGLSVLLGCCHRGIANTLDHIRDLTGEKNFDRIIGGTHLMNAKPERVRKTIDYLQKAVGFREIVPLHCTGPQARTMFAGAFGGRYRTFSCGDTLDFS